MVGSISLPTVVHDSVRGPEGRCWSGGGRGTSGTRPPRKGVRPEGSRVASSGTRETRNDWRGLREDSAGPLSVRSKLGQDLLPSPVDCFILFVFPRSGSRPDDLWVLLVGVSPDCWGGTRLSVVPRDGPDRRHRSQVDDLVVD